MIKIISFVFSILFSFLITTSCGTEYLKATTEFTNEYISAMELKDLMKRKKEVVVIDIRPGNFFDSGHIPGSVNIPYSDVQVIKGKYMYSTPIILYYQSGTIQKNILLDLKGLGFKDVRVLSGGFMSWVSEGN